MAELKGIDLQAVSEWLDSSLEQAKGPYSFELIAAGGSNLTYKVKAGNGFRFVLRRPPVSARIATAHDMQREYRIMSALKNTDVPVPCMLAYCDDASVTGAAFYCMEMIDGPIISSLESTAGMSRENCLVATEALIDAQIAFHIIDLEAVGLADMAQHHGYVERQLKRWKKQVETGSSRDVPEFNQLHNLLVQSAPESSVAPGLAHGDYRFDNTIMTEDYRIAAVLDWELCTIGDPVADFVWSLNYWSEPGEELHWLLSPPTQNPNFPNRQYVIDMYSEKSGITIDHLTWYNAFSWWKQACIVEGVYARLLKGASGGMKIDSLDHIGELILNYLKRAEYFYQRL